MRINADFTKRVVVHSEHMEWQASPMPGVARRPLDRIGDEVARATTIVRYDKGSHFSAHTHDGGEEFIVLDGVFQDEHGNYRAGYYVRNPPTSSHIPRSDDGCVIFVKLWQFDPADRTHVNTDMRDLSFETEPGCEGVEVATLYQDDHEDVRLERLNANTHREFRADGGAEVLVLQGSVHEGPDALLKHSWLRVPDGQTVRLQSGGEPATLWIKTGHLKKVRAPDQSSGADTPASN